MCKTPFVLSGSSPTFLELHLQASSSILDGGGFSLTLASGYYTSSHNQATKDVKSTPPNACNRNLQILKGHKVLAMALPSEKHGAETGRCGCQR